MVGRERACSRDDCISERDGGGGAGRENTRFRVVRQSEAWVSRVTCSAASETQL